MKREYFGMVFIILFVALLFILDYFFGENFVKENLYTFVVVWILLAYNFGQYSMKFPKAF